MTANGSTVSFESDENILKLTQCWLYNYVKSLKSLDYILRFFKDFLMRTNFKVFIESITILFLFCFGFFGQKQCGIFLSSLIRDQTCTPCIERPSLNHWTTREVSEFYTWKYEMYGCLSKQSCLKKKWLKSFLKASSSMLKGFSP